MPIKFLPFLRSRSFFWFSAIALLVLAAVLRTYNISLRPLHSDEGVNFYFLQRTHELGYYPYSHENYHGPLFFYLAYTLFYLVSSSDLGLRAAAILPSIALVATPLLLISIVSRRLILLSMAAIAVSSSLVFYGRYCIHESLFLLGGTLLAFAVLLWFYKRLPRYHYLSGLSLAILITTKETFIITLFCVFWAFMAMGDWRQVGRDLWQQRRHIIAALLLAVFLILLVFSGGFQWAGGLREMLLAVPQWVGRNESDVGHQKTFWYYSNIMFGRDLADFFVNKLGFGKQDTRWLGPTEPQLWLALVLPVYFLIASFKTSWSWLTERSSAYSRFLAVWACTATLVYCFVRYKTPWLIINITLPLSLLAVERIIALRQVDIYEKILKLFVVLIFLGFSLGYSREYNFEMPYGRDNPFCYVHSQSGILDLLIDIEDYAKTNPEPRILVGAGQYWPLPYYLRARASSLSYKHLEALDETYFKGNNDILILNSTINVDRPGWLKKYYRTSDVQEVYVYYANPDGSSRVAQ